MEDNTAQAPTAPVTPVVPPAPPAQTKPINIPRPIEPKKGFPKTIIILVVILLLVSVVGAGAYFLAQNAAKEAQTNSQSAAKLMPTATPTLTPTPTPTPDPTADWQAYTNTKIGFVIKYPSRYTSKPGLPSGAPGSPTLYADGTETNNDIIFGETSDDSYDLQIFPTLKTSEQVISSGKYFGQSDIVTPVKKLQVAGIEATYVTSAPPTISPGSKTPIINAVIFVSKGYGFILETHNDSPGDELEQILSTFTFTQ